MVKGLEAPAVEEEELATVSSSQGVIFVLENAILEAAKVGKVLKTFLTFCCVAHLCTFMHRYYLLAMQH